MSKSGSICLTMIPRALKLNGLNIRYAFMRIWIVFSGFLTIRIQRRRFSLSVGLQKPIRIAERYEIGSHTMNHQLVWQQDRATFKEDVSSSIKLLEDITGKPVKYFRAPGFSIRESEPWAFEVIKECGIEIDCSVFPAHHAHGGIPSYGRAIPSIIKYEDVELKEFPICTKELFGRHLIFSGGGYFRLFPYWLIKKWAIEKQDYLISYIHPRDLDAGQPVIKELPFRRKFKSYVGLGKAERKLRRMLTDFCFTDISEAAKQIDWTQAPIITLK